MTHRFGLALSCTVTALVLAAAAFVPLSGALAGKAADTDLMPASVSDMALVTAAGAVAEVGGEGYATLADAVAAVPAGGVVKLVDDVETTSTVSVGKAMTLDLGGHSLTYTNSSANAAILNVTQGGDLTIVGDGAITTTVPVTAKSIYGVIVRDGGKATLAGGVVEKARYGFTVYEGGTLDVRGGTVDAVNNAVWVYGGILSVFDGELKASTLPAGVAVTQAAVRSSASGGAVYVSGGSLEGGNLGIWASKESTIRVSGGSVNGGAGGSGIYLTAKSDVAVSGGSVSGGPKGMGLYDTQGSTITVSGGSVGAGYRGIYSAGGNVEVCGTGRVWVKDSGLAGVSSAIALQLSGQSTCVLRDDARVDNDNELDEAQPTYGIFMKGNGGTISMSGNASVRCPGGFGVCLFDNDAVTVEGGSITSHWQCLSNNGSDKEPSTMTVTGGTLESDTLGIYHPGPGELAIGGDAVIRGAMSGVEMRAGSLAMTGGAVESTRQGTVAVKPNGSGSTTLGAGIVVAQHTTRKPISVSVSGGAVSGSIAVLAVNPQGNAEGDEDLAIDITGGLFKGDDSGAAVAVLNGDERVKVAISGGAYSSNPSASGVEVSCEDGDTGEAFVLVTSDYVVESCISTKAGLIDGHPYEVRERIGQPAVGDVACDYDGAEKTCIEPGPGYELKDASATNAGSYTAVATPVARPSSGPELGYAWDITGDMADEDRAIAAATPLSVDWEIAAVPTVRNDEDAGVEAVGDVFADKSRDGRIVELEVEDVTGDSDAELTAEAEALQAELAAKADAGEVAAYKVFTVDLRLLRASDRALIEELTEDFGTLTLTFKLADDASLDGRTARIVQLHEQDGGSVVQIDHPDATVANGKVSVTVDRLSEFAIAVDAAADDEPGATPGGADEPSDTSRGDGEPGATPDGTDEPGDAGELDANAGAGDGSADEAGIAEGDAGNPGKDSVAASAGTGDAKVRPAVVATGRELPATGDGVPLDWTLALVGAVAVAAVALFLGRRFARQL